ncbi:concanavalin A-like lectin/glucanase domain-containing protein [Rhexocercosporidium sp. MPI-PUGE-AT-0058]|nr:concanavalin A-like lectin/glucanase domain-containing protein [Rhexocercosporidium sp. MPI-PUGE-AT-0058]
MFLFTCVTALFFSGISAKSETLCGQYDRYTSSSSSFTFGANQWGDDGSGSQCVKVANDDTVFNATWKWSDNADSVHSFPNIKLNSADLPLQLSNLSSLNITASWSMTAASQSKTLDEIDTAANVIIDMFLDPSPVSANSTTLPKYEIMIWLAEFGGKRPIGFSSSIKKPPHYSLNSTDFTLYSGPNSNGQFVYSWLGSTNITDFDEDISPLLHYLWRHKLIDDSNYLGVVQFGTETFHASSNVVFSAHDYNLSIAAGKPSEEKSASTTIVPNLTLIIVFSALVLLEALV